MHSRLSLPRLRLRPSVLVIAAALAACSARGGGGLTTTTGDSGANPGRDVGGTTSGTLTFTCEQLCAPLAGEPSCSGAGLNTCLTTCTRSIASTPEACAASANALYACTRTATPSCSTSTVFPFPSCMGQYNAYASCVLTPSDAGAPPRDSGSPADECISATSCSDCTGRSTCGWCGGRCWRGMSSGPIGGSCGDAPWAWTSGQCSATPPPRDAGGGVSPACQQCAFAECPEQASACSSDPACLQCVLAPNATCLSNPRFGAVAECACGACAEACGPLCGEF